MSIAAALKFFRVQWTPLPIATPPEDIRDRTYVVVGANTGLGFECAKRLAGFGAGRLILAVRTSSKGEAALAQIRRDTGRPTLGEVWQVDLESFDSVGRFAKRLQTLDRLDALVANAGVVMTDYRAVEELESSLVVNVLSTFLLALRALPKLKETADKVGHRTNLTIVGSGIALFPSLKDKFDDLEGNVFEALNDPSTMESRYEFTKQLALLATRVLAARFPVGEHGVTINISNPGLCRTSLSRNERGMKWARITLLQLLVARAAEQGSRALVHGALAGPETHGKYLSECLVHNDHIPPWLRGNDGARKEQRVWADLVTLLTAKGHAVDLARLGAKEV